MEFTLIGWIIRWIYRFFPGHGKTFSELASVLKMEEPDLKSIPINYERYYIPKRSGSYRLIYAPDDDLKNLQRRLLHRLFAKLKIHPAATGFRKGKSIVHNALPHMYSAVLLKLDVVDFFHSSKKSRVYEFFRKIGWNRIVANQLADWCCTGTSFMQYLPQGAPTSPVLSNAMNYEMDCRIAAFVKKQDATYTRYADDITISWKIDDPALIKKTSEFIEDLLPKYGYYVHTGTNGKKRHVLRKHQQQKVTGIVVNQKLSIPKKTRRKLRAVEHRLKSGKHATMTKQQLDGWKAYQTMIDRFN